MRTLDIGFRTHIESRATTLARCWKLTRCDELVLGFTDHDQLLRFDGVDYLPMADAADMPTRLGAQVDTGEIAGILHADAIAEADIVAGLYGGASVEIWQVNWNDVAQRVRIGVHTIGEMREDGLFRAELRSGQQALNRIAGRIYSPLCDAVLGDARCQVSTAHANFAEGCDRRLATCRERFDNVRIFVASRTFRAPISCCATRARATSWMAGRSTDEPHGSGSRRARLDRDALSSPGGIARRRLRLPRPRARRVARPRRCRCLPAELSCRLARPSACR